MSCCRELRAKDLERLKNVVEDLRAREKKGLTKDQKEELATALKVTEWVEGGTDVRCAVVRGNGCCRCGQKAKALQTTLPNMQVWGMEREGGGLPEPGAAHLLQARRVPGQPPREGVHQEEVQVAAQGAEAHCNCSSLLTQLLPCSPDLLPENNLVCACLTAPVSWYPVPCTSLRASRMRVRAV